MRWVCWKKLLIIQLSVQAALCWPEQTWNGRLEYQNIFDRWHFPEHSHQWLQIHLYQSIVLIESRTVDLLHLVHEQSIRSLWQWLWKKTSDKDAKKRIRWRTLTFIEDKFERTLIYIFFIFFLKKGELAAQLSI